jgi:trk system potassium uptake protein
VNVIIIGCGRVGSTLALGLDGEHNVCVIDRDEAPFVRLGDRFRGRSLRGVGFDRDVLREAGISRDSAVAAVTSGDNSNILAARVAREVFGVERVVARIYDPRRATIYERLGIPTVASVAWTTQRALRRLFPSGAEADWTDPTGRFTLTEVAVTAEEAGTTVDAHERATTSRVMLLTRLGRASVPAATTIVQEGDLLHVLADTQPVGAPS